MAVLLQDELAEDLMYTRLQQTVRLWQK